MNLKCKKVQYTLNKKTSLQSILEINDTEYLVENGNSFLYKNNSSILPVRRHQFQEDLLKKQKEFASLIYMERDNERV